MSLLSRPLAGTSARAPRLGRALRLIVLAGGTWSALGCPPPPADCTVTSVSVSPSSGSLVVGASQQLAASVNSRDCAVPPAASWSSSNPSVATVAPGGLVTAVAPGTVQITASAAAAGAPATGQATITVTQAPVATVAVSVPNATMEPGGTQQATAELRSAANAILTGRTVTWSSSAPNVAQVNATTGVITAVAPGAAAIIAAAEGRVGTVNITVALPAVATISVSVPSATMFPGATQQATAVLRGASNTVLTGRTVTWRSTADAVATVDQAGIVTAVAPGITNITAASEGRTGTVVVTVAQVPVASVSVTPASASLLTGASQELTATVRDASGAALTGRAIMWTTSSASVATVAQNGNVTAVAPGTATITATAEGRSGTATITVTAANSLIHRWTFSETGGAGTTLRDDIGGKNATIVNVGAANATVGQGRVTLTGGNWADADYVALPSGLVKGLPGLTLEVWASALSFQPWGRIFDIGRDDLSDLSMTWNTGAPDTDRVEWQGGSLSISNTMRPFAFGALYQVVITVQPDGCSPGVAYVRWYKDGFARVSPTCVTATLADIEDVNFWLGRSNFSRDATAHAVYDEVRIYNYAMAPEAVNVRFREGPVADSPVPVAAVSVSPTSASLVVGGPPQLLTAAPRSSSGFALTGRTTVWTTSDAAVATVSPSGTVTAVAPGTATITATVEGRSATATITVTAANALIHRWTFSETGGAGTTLRDDIGGKNATIVNVGAANATVGQGRVTLAGGDRTAADYVAMPPKLISGLTSVTLELWATQLSVKAWGRIFDIGDAIGNYLMMSWTQAASPSTDRVEWMPGGFRVDDTMAPYTLGTEFQIVLTVRQDGCSVGVARVEWYRNGVPRGTQCTSLRLSSVDDVNFWLGRSAFAGDETANAAYNEVRIYNYALDAAAVSSRYNAGPVADAPALTLEVTPSTAQLTPKGQQQLTAVVKQGAATVSPQPTISWTTSNANVMSVSNTGLADAGVAGTATITATASVGGTALTRSVNLSVAVPSECAPVALPADGEARVRYTTTTCDANRVFLRGTSTTFVPTTVFSVPAGPTPHFFLQLRSRTNTAPAVQGLAFLNGRLDYDGQIFPADRGWVTSSEPTSAASTVLAFLATGVSGDGNFNFYGGPVPRNPSGSNTCLPVRVPGLLLPAVVNVGDRASAGAVRAFSHDYSTASSCAWNSERASVLPVVEEGSTSGTVIFTINWPGMSPRLSLLNASGTTVASCRPFFNTANSCQMIDLSSGGSNNINLGTGLYYLVVRTSVASPTGTWTLSW